MHDGASQWRTGVRAVVRYTPGSRSSKTKTRRESARHVRCDDMMQFADPQRLAVARVMTLSAVEQKWRGLTNALGGLFCSSLNNLDSKMTVSPALTFSPTFASSSASSPFFHALLPLERPCTENLTPLIAQLPCRASAGLATLLNPHRLFDANWQKLALHVVRDPESSHINITLEFEVVQDPVRMTSAVGAQARRDWSFETLFERPIDKACPVADSSVITVDVSKEDEESGYSLEPGASAIQLPTIDNTAVYDVQICGGNGMLLALWTPRKG